MIQPRSSLRRTVVALLLVAAAVPAARPAAAQTGFKRIGDYVLMVNGQEDKGAEIYQNDSVPAYLILPNALPSPILLTPRAGTVETVNLMKVAKQKDGTADLLPNATLAQQGKFQIQDGKVTFSSEGKQVAMSPNPPLLGLKKNADLKAHSPEYARSAQSYTPNPAAMQMLKKEKQPVTVRTFFGSWCPHCKEHVPLLLKVEDQLGASKIRFEYYGMPRDFKDPEAQRLRITGVPTAIIYVNGRQVGRMEAQDWAAPEVSLSKLLGPSPAAGKSGK
jgi:thiol-disulfide isomerase/thioredoxin